MADMGLSSAYGKLPDWAKIMLASAESLDFYGLGTEGPTFLLKALLKPVP